MSKFVYGQLVEMTNITSAMPPVCRYAGISKDGYILHHFIFGDKPPFVKSKYIKEIEPKNLLMWPGRTYNFKPEDLVVYRVRKDHLSDYVDELGVVEQVNNEWKFVILTQPTAGYEQTKVMYFEQVLRKREYDRLNSTQRR